MGRTIAHGAVISSLCVKESAKGPWQTVGQVGEYSGTKSRTFHGLYHEPISRLFEDGLNPVEVAAITDHKTMQILKG